MVDHRWTKRTIRAKLKKAWLGHALIWSILSLGLIRQEKIARLSQAISRTKVVGGNGVEGSPIHGSVDIFQIKKFLTPNYRNNLANSKSISIQTVCQNFANSRIVPHKRILWKLISIFPISEFNKGKISLKKQFGSLYDHKCTHN